jgi:metal-responsive CopG/Arc/MetJ family transcriptional regulator
VELRRLPVTYLTLYVRLCDDRRMKRTAVFLTEEQLADLQAIYRATGAKASESIRRAINGYLAEHKEEIREGLKAPRK